ncbi:NYN domain-containing protein [Saccharothrix syringae]|uniref:NYN domain-containing protein n=1 Tax=Saccharothrix syringae TaxID=103733 RepID=A0A5Q0H2F1_SACSY|nr:NYN domain-containing protein [Saccharothrix syringae]
MEEAFVRIGVFYDGTWFAYLSDFYATVHPRAARISLDGLHDALRWHVHTETGHPFEECVVPEAHYVRGRIDTPATSFDAALAAAGVTRHDLPLLGGKEKGVDVHFALEVWDRATTSPLQWVVLITGDADFTPLAGRLTTRGVRVVVPVVEPRMPWFPSSSPPEWTPRTAAPLRAAATSTPAFDDLFAPADRADSPLRSPFVASRQAAASPAGTPRGRRRGTVTGWQPGQSHGFITDTRGGSWFASRDDLPGSRTMLPSGTPVSFTGSPVPPPGHRYPRAYSIRTEPDSAMSHRTP